LVCLPETPRSKLPRPEDWAAAKALAKADLRNEFLKMLLKLENLGK
jgi:hypothetical protein